MLAQKPNTDRMSSTASALRIKTWWLSNPGRHTRERYKTSPHDIVHIFKEKIKEEQKLQEGAGGIVSTPPWSCTKNIMEVISQKLNRSKKKGPPLTPTFYSQNPLWTNRTSDKEQLWWPQANNALRKNIPKIAKQLRSKKSTDARREKSGAGKHTLFRTPETHENNKPGGKWNRQRNISSHQRHDFFVFIPGGRKWPQGRAWFLLGPKLPLKLITQRK